MALSPGIKAPDFTLPSTSGELFNLYNTKKGKPVILYFYPADFTTGCTKEACGYRDTYDLFQSYDIDVVGVSKDSIDSHLKFKKAYNLPFELLADSENVVSRLYDAFIPIIKFTKRITYLLDSEQNIAASYENIFAAKLHIAQMVKKVKERY